MEFRVENIGSPIYQVLSIDDVEISPPDVGELSKFLKESGGNTIYCK